MNESTTTPGGLDTKVQKVQAHSFHTHLDQVMNEIDTVLSSVDAIQVEQMVQTILSHKKTKIVGIGAGRVGMATKGFVMRLGHMGYHARFIGDTTVPHIGEGDLLIACSGSGETQTIYDLVVRAKDNGAKIMLVTGNRESRMGQLADQITEIKAPSKTKQVAGVTSVQPMTTLNEQCLSLFFDTLVLQMMDQMGESHETMWDRHSNLE